VTRALLADENMPLPVINGLIAAGYDVLAVVSVSPGINDRAVLDLARNEGRCLLTFDSDFGDLIFFHGALPPPAILYFRIHPMVVGDVLAAALCALVEVSDGVIAVVTRDDIRLRSLAAIRSID